MDRHANARDDKDKNKKIHFPKSIGSSIYVLPTKGTHFCVPFVMCDYKNKRKTPHSNLLLKEKVYYLYLRERSVFNLRLIRKYENRVRGHSFLFSITFPSSEFLILINSY